MNLIATDKEIFPPVPLTEWEQTKKTLHLYLQIIGKIRLGQMPRKNHWWHVTLYVTSRGLGTGAIPCNKGSFDMEFDFIKHQLVIRTSKGGSRIIKLHNGLSVSSFYTRTFEALEELGLKIKILAKPYDVPGATVPFANDQEHHHYEPEKVNRFWRVMLQVDQVFKEFSGRFYGKTCPVQVYWHHFDLTVTRFSGEKATVRPEASVVEKDAYSHEVISFGFWPGDETVREPAFYSYTYPSPDGLDKEKLEPATAQWIDSNGSPMALLKYEDLRQENNPREALLNFLESAYQAGAKLAKWKVEDLNVPELDKL